MTTADPYAFLPEDDCYHRLSDDPYETETNWWSFNVPERGIGGWIHTPYYPNRKTVTWRIFVWDTRGWDIARMAYYRKVEEVPMPDNPDLRDITFPGGGYSLKMLEPGMKYHLAYADPDRDFALDFVFTGAHPPRRFEPGEPPFMATPHYDQLGHVAGTLTLDGEAIPLDCWSVRDRTWGPRGGPYTQSRKQSYASDLDRVSHPGGPRWREIERERGRGRIQYIFGHADGESGFLGFVRPQEGTADGWSPMNGGYLLRDGIYGNLDPQGSRMRVFRDPSTGWASHMQVELVDQEGRTMFAEGMAISRMSEHGYGTNQLLRWEFDGKIGWGEDQDIWNPRHFQRMLHALRRPR
ncbi:hypothetical protein OLX02_12560 [Novosphingobium sp. KCTC 2891]|uniref:DUF7065 domain-containing protein n=1 Tax=Novosphingobium sp. KCTC 2891 TaxID=2989730 RepID=UPI0022214FF5|nr:hypothetical protein [Novosphingobium sp. KCTC 2891]MCW1383653.1 hypothetical protein [Novosphingobium sp. KCTC 2891]